ncbi:MAG TPA: alpha/beta fold hydrolase [Actinomycetota bacterium]|nr:alpha/beta fold hydrolase [Actinomycetota bacterium]
MHTITTPSGEVSVAVDGGDSSGGTIVLAHGAGAGMNHEFMQEFARGLAELDLTVFRFNFLYTEQSRKAPDRQPLLEETYRSVVEALRPEAVAPLVLGGKSMGGRIASHIAAGGTACDGLVFLGYPLHPPGRPDRIRDAHLADVGVPMLFVEGTRDPFCPLDTLEEVRGRLGPSDLVVIDDGDHSFKVRKSSGRSTREALLDAINAVATWVSKLS